MNPIKFNLNEPQVLSLSDPTGDLVDDSTVVYPTSDGRLLSLPRHVAIKLNALWPQPGEEISITRYRKDPEQPAEWVVALTPRTEQQRAEQEAQKAAIATRQDLAGQLERSIPRKSPTRTTSPVHQMPKSAHLGPSDPSEDERGTGTYGPLPQVALGGRKLKSEAIPFNIAFSEVTRFVTAGLKEAGEQWNDQAKQDAICTILIAGSKSGYIGPWERPQ